MATLQPISLLDDAHAQTLRQAVANILATEIAEFTYAQILDGLPTRQSLLESCNLVFDHPVCKMNHTLCDGFLEKARRFRSHFDPSTLAFDKDALTAFQKADAGSEEFNLRLVELVVVACHQIGAYLYELDDGAHKHSKSTSAKPAVHTTRPRTKAAFAHRFYQDSDQYPRGLADLAGYWAEGSIFGGVVVFDRGESEQECKAMWIHGIRDNGPRTLYPPTADQFKALVAFLASPGQVECPLPVHGTQLNRPRWDPDDSMRFHIFRDRYERKPRRRPPFRVNNTTTNWPELTDKWAYIEMSWRRGLGEPIDQEAWDAASEGMYFCTPSSPMWRSLQTGAEPK